MFNSVNVNNDKDLTIVCVERLELVFNIQQVGIQCTVTLGASRCPRPSSVGCAIPRPI